MTELICITCPKGCHLRVDEEKGFAVTGNSCPRGAEYGRNELQHPVRTVTSITADAPVHVGDVLAADILGTDVNIVATKTM